MSSLFCVHFNFFQVIIISIPTYCDVICQFRSRFLIVDDELLREVDRTMQADQALVADGRLVVDDQDTAAEDGQAKELLIVFWILLLGTKETFDIKQDEASENV